MMLLNMVTAENINANGAALSQAMVRKGFFKFPQSVEAHIATALYPQIAGIEMPFAYPFTVIEDDAVPPNEVWYLDSYKALVGRIVNLALSAPTVVTSNDKIDFIDQEHQGEVEKTKKQKDRRIKDALL